jgi:hypothetical protein
MTYLGPDGRQYIAIESGIGGAATVHADLLAHAGENFPAGGNTLYVFSLGGDH